MEQNYKIDQLETTVTYGQTFAAQLKRNELKKYHILIITNQRYYDLYSNKFIQLFGPTQCIDWYICNNDVHCNNLNELESVLDFLNDFNLSKEYLYIGIGNEGVVQLTNYLQQVSVFRAACWLIPLSIRALGKSLLPIAQIEKYNQPVMNIMTLAQKIIFDQTLVSTQKDGKLVDFFVFIRCGLVCSHEFLKMLFRNFSNRTRLEHQSFSGILDKMIISYQKSGAEIDSFGELFEDGFSEIHNGSLLSGPMKKFLGCLLQLLWSYQNYKFTFHYKNFLIWLLQLGFPIDFPEQILVSDYTDGVLRCISKGNTATLLMGIGQLGTRRAPTAIELVALVEEYKIILNEIKG